MITRESLNKLGKAKADKYAEPYDDQANRDVVAKLSFQAGFSSALELLWPGVEALRSYANGEHYAGDSWETPSGESCNILCAGEDLTIEDGAIAREFLAKLERELA